jgi:hypothetical protein
MRCWFIYKKNRVKKILCNSPSILLKDLCSFDQINTFAYFYHSVGENIFFFFFLPVHTWAATLESTLKIVESMYERAASTSLWISSVASGLSVPSWQKDIPPGQPEIGFSIPAGRFTEEILFLLLFSATLQRKSTEEGKANVVIRSEPALKLTSLLPFTTGPAGINLCCA